MGHADGHVAPLQGREEFLARPQCALRLGLGKKRDALVIELQRMVPVRANGTVLPSASSVTPDSQVQHQRGHG